MSLIAKLLPASNVVTDLQVSSKKRLFEQAGLLFENRHGIAKSIVFDSLFARERLGSTGLGQGVAIPHGRIKGLKDSLCAFVRLAQPVPFDAPDGNPVSLVFVLLVPEQARSTCRCSRSSRRCSATRRCARRWGRRPTRALCIS
jgi:PTS system nitrogen regulatory IIA component